MRGLMSITRRRFGQGLGASLALTIPSGAVLAQSGPREFEVRISDFVFAPDLLEVTEGDVVVWMNNDVAPHTATARDGSWDTGRLAKDQKAQLRFDVPGKFEYYCVFHPHMTGEILVRPKEET